MDMNGMLYMSKAFYLCCFISFPSRNPNFHFHKMETLWSLMSYDQICMRQSTTTLAQCKIEISVRRSITTLAVSKQLQGPKTRREEITRQSKFWSTKHSLCTWCVSISRSQSPVAIMGQ